MCSEWDAEGRRWDCRLARLRSAGQAASPAGLARQANGEAGRRLRSPCVPRTSQWASISGRARRAAVISPNYARVHQRAMDDYQIHAATLQVGDRSVVRERSRVVSQLEERPRKKAAVAVYDRLPVPRAVEHVEAVVNVVKRVGLRERAPPRPPSAAAPPAIDSPASACHARSATPPCACGIRASSSERHHDRRDRGHVARSMAHQTAPIRMRQGRRAPDIQQDRRPGRRAQPAIGKEHRAQRLVER